MRAIVALMTVAYPAVALAQAVPATRQAQRIPGLSDAGAAVVQKARAASAPALAPLVRQLADTRSALATQAGAEAIDAAQIETLVRQQERLSAQIRTLNNTAMLSALKALAPDDQKALLRSMTAAGTAAAPAR